MAQNVYSLNVVGYVNVTIPGGYFSAIANPLDNTATGGNSIANLFPTAPVDSSVSFWDPAAYGGAGDWVIVGTCLGGGVWDPDGTVQMPVAKAAQFYNAGATFVQTFVGEVKQGPYTVATMNSGSFNLLGAPAPIGGALENSLIGLTPAVDDQVQGWDPLAYGGAGDWTAAETWIGSSWDPGTMTLAPAAAFLYYRAGGAVTWQSNFTVN